MFDANIGCVAVAVLTVFSRMLSYTGGSASGTTRDGTQHFPARRGRVGEAVLYGEDEGQRMHHVHRSTSPSVLLSKGGEPRR